jgi:hypothetical protein
MTDEPAWREWIPGLENDDLTLREVYETLPGAGPEEIDQIVRLLENPASPYALPGASSLRVHDCIHILIGRGLLNQDEAFVIGYTMGTAKEGIDSEQVQLFRLAAKLLYKPPYTMSDSDLIAFDLGFAAGSISDAHRLFEFDCEAAMNRPLGELRRELGIDLHILKSAFREERRRLPENRTSKRLPV